MIYFLYNLKYQTSVSHNDVRVKGLVGHQSSQKQTLPAVAAHNGQSGLSEPASPLASANASRTPRHALPITPDWIWFHTEAASSLCARGNSRCKTMTSEKQLLRKWVFSLSY